MRQEAGQRESRKELAWAAGIAAATAGLVLGFRLWPEPRWEGPILHGALQGMAAFAITATAVLVLAIRERGRGWSDPALAWIVAGLIGMGLLGMIHASISGDLPLVPLHPLAILVGGLGFAAIWLPWGKGAENAPWAVTALAGIIALALVSGLGDRLGMVPEAHGTRLESTMNILGGLGFLLGAVRLLASRSTLAHEDRGALIVFAAAFGTVGLALPGTETWDPGWWFCHWLQFGAGAWLLGRSMLAYRRADARLRAAMRELEDHVDRRTRDLQAEIEQRRLTEKALLASERRLRDMAEASSDWLWEMGPDLIFTWVSESIRKVLGVEPRDLIGKARSEVMVPCQGPEKLQAFLADLAARRPFRDYEFLFARPNGEARHLRLGGRPVYDTGGDFAGYRGSASDISDLIRREAALRDEERKRRAIVEATNDSVLMLTPEGVCLTINSAAAARFHRGAEELVGRDLFALLPPEVAEGRRRHIGEAVRTRRTVHFSDVREGIAYDQTVHPIEEEDGTVSAVVIFARDVTEQRRTAEHVKQLASFPEENPSPVLRVSREGVLLYANRASSLLLDHWHCETGTPIPESIQRVCREVLRSGTRHESEIDAGPLAFSLFYVPAGTGATVSIYGRNVTRFRLAQEALAQSEARAEEAWRRLRDALQSISESFAMYDSADRLVLFNAPFVTMWAGLGDKLQAGVPYAELIAMAAEKGLIRQAAGRRWDWSVELVEAHRQGGRTMELQFEDGTWWLLSDRRTEDGGTVSIGTDITALKEREQALRRSEESLAAAQRIAQLGSWEWDLEDGTLRWSEETYRILGQDPATHQPTYVAFLEMVHPEDRPRFVEIISRTLEEGSSLGADVRVVRPDGQVRIVHSQGRVIDDAEGYPRGMSGTVQDVTERKRRETEFLQVQKMEAIGQLTGGIAHDFNNILTVVRGNVELVHERLAGEANALLREILEDALSAADQGQHLTGGLLAFARRETVHAEAVDVNAAARRMVSLLRRTLHSFIAVETDLAEDLPAAFCDRRLLETALLNLALNARDAMPEGGRLTIASHAHDETDADGVLPPGRYVALAVRDTGVGIPPAVRERIFEPLFTTKKEGKGTGLGLRMVDLFVRQSGGRIVLDSRVGEGTTFTLVLPLAETQPARGTGKGPARLIASGMGQALVVDDDPSVRRFGRRCLEEMGFTVREVASAEEALEILDRDPAIGLVLSDLLMPGSRGGLYLAQEALKRYPDLRIVLASGSVNAVEEARDSLPETVPVLAKPFSPAELAAAVARIA